MAARNEIKQEAAWRRKMWEECVRIESMNWRQFGGKWSSIVNQDYIEAFSRVKQGLPSSLNFKFFHLSASTSFF